MREFGLNARIIAQRKKCTYQECIICAAKLQN